MKKNIQIAVIVIISVFILTIYLNRSDIDGYYVSNKIYEDTLVINTNNLYERRIKGLLICKGEWRLVESHIWLYSWVNKGECIAMTTDERGTCAFIVGRNLVGRINEIIFDVDDLPRYKRI